MKQLGLWRTHTNYDDFLSILLRGVAGEELEVLELVCRCSLSFISLAYSEERPAACFFIAGVTYERVVAHGTNRQSHHPPHTRSPTPDIVPTHDRASAPFVPRAPRPSPIRAPRAFFIPIPSPSPRPPLTTTSTARDRSRATHHPASSRVASPSHRPIIAYLSDVTTTVIHLGTRCDGSHPIRTVRVDHVVVPYSLRIVAIAHLNEIILVVV